MAAAPVTTVRDITRLAIADGDITIDASGRSNGCKKAVVRGDQVSIGGSTFSKGTLRVGSSIVTGGSLMVNSSNSFSSNGCVLSGKEHTPISINGLAATFGQFIAAYRYAHNRPDFLAATHQRPEPNENFILAPSVRGQIKHISAEGSGKLLSIDASWLANTLTVHATGSATIELPKKNFDFLTLSAAGSSDIKGASDAGTRAKMGNVNASGSADIAQIYITVSGNVMASGSADVSISAANRDTVLKTKNGSTDIKIRQRDVTTPPPSSSRSTHQQSASSHSIKQEPVAPSLFAVTIKQEDAPRKRKHEEPTSAVVSVKREKHDHARRAPTDRKAVTIKKEPLDDDEVVIISPTDDDSAWD